MILPLLILGSVTYADCHILERRVQEYRESVLSPFPAYPLSGATGAPRASKVTVQGKEYIIYWDGEELSIHPLNGYWPDGVRDERIDAIVSEQGNGHREHWIVRIRKGIYGFYAKGKFAIRRALEKPGQSMDEILKIPPAEPPIKPPNGNGDSHGDNWSRF